MYEVGLSRRFQALHVMPDDPGPEGELHAHAYRLDVVVQRSELDDRGMVVDLDVLEDALEQTVNKVEDKDLEVIRPRDAYAVTVEVLSKWAHDEIVRRLGANPSLNLLVRAWESDDAFGGYWSRGTSSA
jgi:6-pyruvoyltetrahydropterin/6-carboxytetrahydropterin synthase